MITDDLNKIRTDDVTEFSELHADFVEMAEDAIKTSHCGAPNVKTEAESPHEHYCMEINIPAVP